MRMCTTFIPFAQVDALTFDVVGSAVCFCQLYTIFVCLFACMRNAVIQKSGLKWEMDKFNDEKRRKEGKNQPRKVNQIVRMMKNFLWSLLTNTKWNFVERMT